MPLLFAKSVKVSDSYECTVRDFPGALGGAGKVRILKPTLHGLHRKSTSGHFCCLIALAHFATLQGQHTGFGAWKSEYSISALARCITGQSGMNYLELDPYKLKGSVPSKTGYFGGQPHWGSLDHLHY